MRNAADYLGHVKALVMLNRQVLRWKVVRDEAQGDVGMFRYQLTLRDGSILEMFERFGIAQQKLQVTTASTGRAPMVSCTSGGTTHHTTERCPHIPITFTRVEMQTCWRMHRSAPKKCSLSSPRKYPSEGLA